MQDEMRRPCGELSSRWCRCLSPRPGSRRPRITLKIGLITTLSSPAATAGPEMVDGFKLGIKDSGDALGDRPVDLIVGDDQLKPDVSVQLARKMLDEDKVQIIAGMIPSNVALAVAHVVLPRKVFLLSLNAGPSQLAGAECSPYFFSVSYQNDTAAEAMAIYLQGQGKTRAALIAANYAAGRDMMTGFKRYFKGEILREIYTPLGQFDFAAELADIRSAKPDAVFYFEQSGSPSINLVRQYAELGLKSVAPLYGVTFVLDESSLPGMGDAALGIESASYWNAALDFPAAKAFVAHFRAAYHREPTIFAATAYDGARLIDGAVRMVHGHVERADDFRRALEAAPFPVRARPHPLQHQSFPDSEFLPRRGRARSFGQPHQPVQGRHRQGSRPFLCRRLQDEMTPLLVLEQLLNGVQFGVMLFLMAAGLTLVFGIMNLVNFAHGSLYMIGAYLCAYTYVQTGSYILAIIASLGGTLVIGIAIEMIVFRQLYRRDHLDQVLATFGLILFFNEMVRIIWGDTALYSAVPNFLAGRVTLLPGLTYPLYRLAIIVVGFVVALLLYLLVMKTRLGMLIRAGAANRTMVGALGIDIALLFTLLFGLGAMLAALSGLLAGPVFSVTAGMGDGVLILAIVVIVIGGIGSIRGAFIAAILIGVVDTMGRVFLRPVLASVMAKSAADNAGPALASMLIYILMAVVLFFRPQGLFPPRGR